MGRPPKEPLANGLLWCTRAEGHWVHISDFYQKKDGPIYFRPNKAGDDVVAYHKAAHSWCKACIKDSAKPRLRKDEVGRWEAMTPAQQAEEIRKMREADKVADQPKLYKPERLGPPDQDEGDDGEYVYSDDPEVRHDEALRRLSQGLIDVAEYRRVVSEG